MAWPNIFLFVFCGLIFFFFLTELVVILQTQEVTVSLANAKEVSVYAASSG